MRRLLLFFRIFFQLHNFRLGRVDQPHRSQEGANVLNDIAHAQKPSEQDDAAQTGALLKAEPAEDLRRVTHSLTVYFKLGVGSCQTPILIAHPVSYDVGGPRIPQFELLYGLGGVVLADVWEKHHENTKETL